MVSSKIFFLLILVSSFFKFHVLYDGLCELLIYFLKFLIFVGLSEFCIFNIIFNFCCNFVKFFLIFVVLSKFCFC